MFDEAARWESVPEWFVSAPVEEARRRIDAFFALPEQERAQTDIPPVWKLPISEDVGEALRVLSADRCAFCEQAIATKPYRFRPPANARPGDAPSDRWSYLWRAFDWGNFYPICYGCRPPRQTHFPVDGAREAPQGVGSDRLGRKPREHPGLYHPGEIAAPSAAFSVNAGVLEGMNDRARATIEHYSLNRPDLAEARKTALGQHLAAMLSPWDENVDWSFSDELRHAYRRPFGGALYLLQRDLAERIAEGRAQFRGSLSVARLPDTLGRWRRLPGFDDALRAAVEGLAAPRSAAPAPAPMPPAAPPAPEDRDHAPLRSVAITTFKSLDSIQFELPAALPPDEAAILTSDSIEPPSAPCLLILGENATGKSSILEAIALACLPDDIRDALRIGPVELRARRLTLNPEYMGATGEPPRADAGVTVTFHGADGAAPKTLGIRIDREGTDDGPDGGFHPFGDTEGPRPLVFGYGPNRLYGRVNRPDHTRFVDTLFDGTLHVSNPEAWLLTLKDRTDGALDQIAAALRHIIQIDGAFGHLEIAPDPDDGKDRVWINLRRPLPGGGTRTLRQRLDHASSGYRAVLALVCDVFARLLSDADVTPHDARLSRAIILIDEVEAHLHPRWKLQIIDGLRKALPRATWVLTSHDPLCVRGMRAGEVMMLNRHMTADGAIPETVERIRDFGAFELMTVEQLLTSDMFRLASVDDPKAERRYADLAAAIEAGTATGADTRALDEEILRGMPVGVTEVTNLVQRAVADYMAARRAEDGVRTLARARAEAAVQDFLRDLLA